MLALLYLVWCSVLKPDSSHVCFKAMLYFGFIGCLDCHDLCLVFIPFSFRFLIVPHFPEVIQEFLEVRNFIRRGGVSCKLGLKGCGNGHKTQEVKPERIKA